MEVLSNVYLLYKSHDPIRMWTISLSSIDYKTEKENIKIIIYYNIICSIILMNNIDIRTKYYLLSCRKTVIKTLFTISIFSLVGVIFKKNVNEHTCAKEAY